MPWQIIVDSSATIGSPLSIALLTEGLTSRYDLLFFLRGELIIYSRYFFGG